MKQVIFTAALLLSVISGESMATCSSGGTPVTTLATVLPGNTICVASSNPGWVWEAQESHLGTSGSTSGNLQDYKRGPGNAVDPQKIIGTWSLTQSNGSACTTNCARAIYNYTDSGNTLSYTYRVYLVNGTGTAGSNGSKYDFCADSTTFVVSGTLKTGVGAAC
ncbi:MAG: hypothetical protein NTV43_04960 [Methylococcales bacterium]|nr:hypothetical protein [Methylococcales bacterium]